MTNNLKHGDTGENISMVDEYTGDVIGVVDRHTAHTEGIWHACTHVWIVDANSNLLFQQRASWMRNFPDLWDISAAGHTRPGEDGLREVAEELGVLPVESEIRLAGVFKLEYASNGFINNERPRVYIWKSSLTLSDFSFPDGEVQALASVELKNIDRLIKGAMVACEVLRNGVVATEVVDGSKLVPLGSSYWSLLKNALNY